MAAATFHGCRASKLRCSASQQQTVGTNFSPPARTREKVSRGCIFSFAPTQYRYLLVLPKKLAPARLHHPDNCSLFPLQCCNQAMATASPSPVQPDTEDPHWWLPHTRSSQTEHIFLCHSTWHDHTPGGPLDAAFPACQHSVRLSFAAGDSLASARLLHLNSCSVDILASSTADRHYCTIW